MMNPRAQPYGKPPMSITGRHAFRAYIDSYAMYIDGRG